MFGMGNQFNGFAEEKYLKGLDNRIHTALPQENVKLSKTFTEVLPKASGALPAVINVNSATADTQKALGANVQTLYVLSRVDKKSKSVVQDYNVLGSGAYSGAYLQGYANTLSHANSSVMNFDSWNLNRDGSWSYYKLNFPVKNEWIQDKDGKCYFFDGEGIMWTGWLDWNGYKYYMRSHKKWNKDLKIYIENGGQMSVGWKKIADKWYYFKSKIVNGKQKGGQMVTGWRKIPESGNSYFYFYSDGVMAENVLIKYKGDYYFLKKGGYMAENEEITDPATNKKYKANQTGVCKEIKGSGNAYVNLQQLDDFGFFMGSTNTEREDNVKELNRVLETYAITTDLRISFFMGQIKHESRRGQRTLESFSGSKPEVYFNNKYSNRSDLGNQGGNDGELFRGSGYIHLTGRYNYQKFANYVGDQQIMIDGYKLVGGIYNRPVQNISSSDVGVINIGEYAWESCGWFWNCGNPKTTDLNTYADIKDWHSISSAINQNDTATFTTRNKYINEFYDILTGQSLGLPE